MKIFTYISICLCSVLYAQSDTLSLENIFLKNAFKANSKPPLKFIKEGNQYVTLKDGKLYFWDTHKASVVDSAMLPFGTEDVGEFEYQERSRKLLLKHDIEPIYRRSYLCRVQIYDLVSRQLVPMEQGSKVVNPEWSKDGRKLAYTKSNNLYYFDTESIRSVQLTFDGKKNELINGQADWVYEEEFEITKVYWWNEGGTQIAYLKFDESEVKTFMLQYWKSDAYPELYEYKYPKAGEASSKVSLWVYDLALQKSDSVFCADADYLPRVTWGHNGTLVFCKLNRLQNELELFSWVGDRISSLYKEVSDTYLDLDAELFGNSEALYFTSEKTGYRHIYKLDYKSMKCTALTSGKWDVLEINGLSGDMLYYTHAKSNSYTHELSALSLKGLKSRHYNHPGSAYLVSLSSRYVMVTTSSVLEPPVYSILDSGLGTVREIEGQKELKAKLKTIPQLHHEFIHIPSINCEIEGLLLRSSNFEVTEKHPVLVYQYSGPNYQMVVDEWKGTNFIWFNYLISKGYVVLIVDPRGTGAKGTAFRKSTYLQLGLQESEDMALTSQYLSKQKYVDTTRIQIFGWSFGGYVAALAATKWSHYFDKAVSVAPVTDWRYYDNIYTERYMQTPGSNRRGYDTTSVMKYCKDMNTKFLLLHGTADDNVHIQHSYALQKGLMANYKQFDYFVFADKNHGIAGANTRYYLYKKVTEFLLE